MKLYCSEGDGDGNRRLPTPSPNFCFSNNYFFQKHNTLNIVYTFDILIKFIVFDFKSIEVEITDNLNVFDYDLFSNLKL